MRVMIASLVASAAFLVGCGGGGSEVADDAIAPFTLLAVADFEWAAPPEAGFTTPFSFEVIAPAPDGRSDISYWWEIQDESGAAIGTTPRFDQTWDSEFDHGQLPVEHALPIPDGIEGAYSMIVHVRDNASEATVSHVENLALP